MESMVNPEKQQCIKQAFKELNSELLTPVKEKLGESYSYEEIRLARAKMLRDGEM